MSDQTLPEGVSKDELEQALAQSLATWVATECSPIEPFFAGWTDQAPQPKDGDNTIAWVDDWAARGFLESAPGNTDVQYRGHDDEWQIAETDVYLNASDFDWSTSDGERTSVQAVLTHELGHALGLLHPCEPDAADGAPACEGASSDVEATTMFPFYDPAQASLEDDDIAGLCYLYPVGEECGGGCGRHETCVNGACRAMCGDEICSDGEVCGAWGCTPEGACLDRDCTGRACDAKSTCGPLAACIQGSCTKGPKPWGDACTTSPDCTAGACVDRICQPDCQSDLECGPFGMCVPAVDGHAKGCLSSGAYEQGMRCAAGEDCSSGICIFTEGRASCTTECKTGSACPRDWSCKPVEGRDVCVPPTFQATGGCSVNSAQGPAGPLGWLAVATALLATRKRHRRNDS